MTTFADLLRRTETSGRDPYNTLFAHSQNKFAPRGLTNMTLGEVMDLQRVGAPYSEFVKGKVGQYATPAGAYQVVGTTLRDVVQELGLSPDMPFDQNTQDQIGRHLLDRRLRSAGNDRAAQRNALRQEWEGFKHATNPELDAALDNYAADPNTFSQRTDPDPTRLQELDRLELEGQNAYRRGGASLQYFSDTAEKVAEDAFASYNNVAREAESSEGMVFTNLFPNMRGGAMQPSRELSFGDMPDADGSLRGDIERMRNLQGLQPPDITGGMTSAPGAMTMRPPTAWNRADAQAAPAGFGVDPGNLQTTSPAPPGTPVPGSSAPGAPVPGASASTMSPSAPGVAAPNEVSGGDDLAQQQREYWADALSGLGVALGQLSGGQSPDMISPLRRLQTQRAEQAAQAAAMERQERMDMLAERRFQLDERRVNAEMRRLEMEQTDRSSAFSYSPEYAKRTVEQFPETAAYFDMMREGAASGNKSLYSLGMEGVASTLETAQARSDSTRLPQGWLEEYAQVDDDLERAELFERLQPEQQEVAESLVGRPIQGPPDQGVPPEVIRGAERLQAEPGNEDLTLEQAIEAYQTAKATGSTSDMQVFADILDRQRAEEDAKARGRAVAAETEAITTAGVKANRNMRSLGTIRDATEVMGTFVEGAGAGVLTENLARLVGNTFNEAVAESVYIAAGVDRDTINAMGQEAKQLGFVLAESFGITGQNFSDRDAQLIASMTPGALNTQSGREELVTGLLANNVLDRAASAYVSQYQDVEGRQQAISFINNKLNAAHVNLAEYYELSMEAGYDTDEGQMLRQTRGLIADIAGNPEAEAMLADVLRTEYDMEINTDEYVQDLIAKTFPAMTTDVANAIVPNLLGERDFVGYYDVSTGEFVRREQFLERLND